MSVELKHPSYPADSTEPEPEAAELHCALTGRVLRPEEAYWAPPLITTQSLLVTMFRTLVSDPGNIGRTLLSDLPNVPYAPEARPQLARQRSQEQLKLLLLLLIVAACLIIPIVLLAT
jgi:hypothetical protein